MMIKSTDDGHHSLSLLKKGNLYKDQDLFNPGKIWPILISFLNSLFYTFRAILMVCLFVMIHSVTARPQNYSSGDTRAS